jgi:O-antigen/teichoic acid export membrane protein
MLVSGFNFVIGVLLARQLGLAAFGSYVIAQTYMQYAGGVQSALVAIPMMSAVPLERDPAAQHTMLRGFFAYAVVVLLLTSAGVTAVAWLVGRWSPALALGRGTELWPFCAAMVSRSIQGWPRRALFACTADHAVFFSDLVAYGGQWCVLIFLASRGMLTLGVALWVMAGSFAISAAATGAAVKVSPDFRAVPGMIRRHGPPGRDYLVSAQLQWLGTAGVIMVGTGFIGTQAAAAIRATQNLLGPFNVLFQWMENVIPVRAALRLREGGREQLAVYLNRLSWIGFVAIGLFAGLLPTVDGWLLETIYGAAYRPFAVLVVLQALYYLFGHLYRMQTYYSRSLGRARDVARSSLWWAVVAVSSAVLTVNVLAERGIMIAALAGEVAAILYLVSLRYGSDPPRSGH